VRAVACVFAKPPLPGFAKTRLIPALGADGAAALAGAMLADTWAVVGSVPGLRGVVATTGPLPGALAALPAWDQGDGDLGARVARVLGRALREADGAIALGADAPLMPAARLTEALAALAAGRAAIGPSEDGGFYLLAVPACPPGLLDDLPWSAPTTGARVRARLVAAGMDVQDLPVEADVDEPADLDRLRARLAADPEAAPRTAAALGLVRAGPA
jgi:rSAM/selenodomain-associated transferase 1